MTTRGIRERGEEGVSESIGFLLVFSIIIAGIGLVTLYGYPLLTQQQISADEKIMEKNMIVLQNDVKSLAYKTVPYKETSLKIGGGSLTVYNPGSSSAFDITFTDSLGAAVYDQTFDSGELRYESVSAQTDISLQNGAVLMRPRVQSGSTMLAEPRWFNDVDPNPPNNRTMVINLIGITSDGVLAKEGIGTVQMRLVEIADPYARFDGPGTVVIKYTPAPKNDYSLAWKNFFINTLGMTETDTNEYTLNNVNTFVLKKYEIKIESL